MLICNDIANKGLCNAEAAVQNGPRSTLLYVFSFLRQRTRAKTNTRTSSLVGLFVELSRENHEYVAVNVW